jgi:hypothetical protein
VAHRVRIAVDGLKHSSALARQLEARLVGAPGVRHVGASPVTGTVVVVYEDGWDWRDDTQTLASSLAAGAPEGQVQALAADLAASAARADAPDALASAGAVVLRLLLPLAALLLGARGALAAAEVVVPRWYDVVSIGVAAYALLGAAGVPPGRTAEEGVEGAATV